MNLLRENPIVIKKGINYPMIVGSIIAVIVIIIMGTSNMWLPDGRELMNRGLKQDMIFNGMSVKMNEKYINDVELGLGEVQLEVTSSIDNNDDLKISVFKDGILEYPKESYKVIRGSKLPIDENGSKTYQEMIVQFAVPKDIYYISIVIEQVDNRKDRFDIDYRLFDEGKLSEKDSTYLKVFDDINLRIVMLTNQITEANKELAGFKENYKRLQVEVKQLKTQISITKDETVKAQRNELLGVKENDSVNAKTLIGEKEKIIKELSKDLKKAKHEKADIQ